MLNAPSFLLDGNVRTPYSPVSANPLGCPVHINGSAQSVALQKWPRPFGEGASQYRPVSQVNQTAGSDAFRWGGASITPETSRPIPTVSQSKSWLERKQPLLPTFQDTTLQNPADSGPFLPLAEFRRARVLDQSQGKPNERKDQPAGQSTGQTKVQLHPGRKRADSGALKPSGSADGLDKAKSDDQSRFTGSKMIGAFKVTSALIVTGGMNAFLFGVPIYIASGLAALVASSQALTALKIHKEDTPFTRKMLGFTRKLMGRENDLTPAGKEWSMVPVWAAICGTFGLSEALGNHMYKKFTGYQAKNFEQQSEAIRESIKTSGNGFKKSILNWQLKGMTSVNNAKQKVKVQLERRAALGGTVSGLLNRFYKRVMASSGGKKPGFAYLWSFCMASFAGATQTTIAALMQQKIDQAHGISKPK